MKKEFFLVLALAFTCIAVHAQSSFGLFAEGGVNKLHKRKFSDPYYDMYAPQDYKLSTASIFSSREGIYFYARLSNKFMLGTKLFYTGAGNKVNYNETFYFSGPVAVSREYQLTYTSQERALGFNPYIGYKRKKFLFNLGAQAIDVFREHQYEICYVIENGVKNFLYSKDYLYTHERGFSMDYGITAGGTFQFDPYVALESSFYYGLYREEYRINKFSMRSTQLTIGLKCALWVSGKNGTKEVEQ
jgi:hypothetical protein